jgi:LPXTG-motif cell wall-anchored protein
MRKKILWGGLVLPFLSTIAYAVTGGNHAGKIWETETTIMLLLGVGLIGLAGLGRRMFKHS